MAALSNVDIEHILLPASELASLFQLENHHIKILDPHKVEQAVERGKMVVFPALQPDQIGSWTFDVSCGSTFYRPVQSRFKAYHGRNRMHIVRETLDFREGKPDWRSLCERFNLFELMDGEDEKQIDYVLEPGDFVLGVTEQFIGIPTNLAAEISGKSRNGRVGITAEMSAEVIDAGFLGQLALEIANTGHNRFALYPGLPIAQIKLHELKTPTTKPHYKKGSNFSWQI